MSINFSSVAFDDRERKKSGSILEVDFSQKAIIKAKNSMIQNSSNNEYKQPENVVEVRGRIIVSF